MRRTGTHVACTFGSPTHDASTGAGPEVRLKMYVHVARTQGGMLVGKRTPCYARVRVLGKPHKSDSATPDLGAGIPFRARVPVASSACGGVSAGVMLFLRGRARSSPWRSYSSTSSTSSAFSSFSASSTPSSCSTSGLSRRKAQNFDSRAAYCRRRHTLRTPPPS